VAVEGALRRSTLRRVVAAVVKEQSDEQIGLVASGAAFWLVIAAFPAALAAVSIFGLVVSPQQVADDLSSITKAGPESLGSTLSAQLAHVAATDRVGLSVSLAISIVLALWSVSAAVYNLQRAIRSAYGLGVEEYVLARGRALVAGLVAVLALGALALGSTAISVALAYVPGILVKVVGLPLLVLVIAAVAAGLYRFSIGRPVGLGRLAPGSVASGIGLIALAAGFGWYLRVSTRYAAVYGALAGAVIGMIASYLAIYVLLIGAVLNAQLDKLHGRSLAVPPRQQDDTGPRPEG
jgi:membrane protein